MSNLVIDAHAHIWKRDGGQYPWDRLSNFIPSFEAPIENLLDVMTTAGVSGAALVQPSCYGWDNRYLLDSVLRYPNRFVATVMVDPLARDGPDTLRHCVKDAGARGLRLNAAFDYRLNWLDHPNTYPLWECAAELGIPIGLLIEPWQLPQAEAMIRRFVEVAVIIDHLARIKPQAPDLDKHIADLCALARFPNSYVKVSGFYALANGGYPYKEMHPVVSEVLKSFGAQRLMWASDYPLSTEHDSYASIQGNLDRILPELDAGDRKWLLGGTANRLWHLIPDDVTSRSTMELKQ
jgi:predicted TIM-barrel fold metal-dependent hydrolase